MVALAAFALSAAAITVQQLWIKVWTDVYSGGETAEDAERELRQVHPPHHRTPTAHRAGLRQNPGHGRGQSERVWLGINAAGRPGIRILRNGHRGGHRARERRHHKYHCALILNLFIFALGRLMYLSLPKCYHLC
uniref:Secreted protein n=1 Tax=Amblyomma tuberculatum TaxID=48802 RepID=A0A6M2E2Q7_9ACAR